MNKKVNIKNFIKFIALVLIVLCSASYSFAQVNKINIAATTIIEPISIEWIGNMHFGNVAVSSKSAGTVLLAPTGKRKAAGGVKLSTMDEKVAAARISVAGMGNSTYAITLPTTVTLTSGTNTITATAFTSYPANSGQIATGGTQALSVGATLNIGAAKPSGMYIGTAFAVTVNYN